MTDLLAAVGGHIAAGLDPAMFAEQAGVKALDDWQREALSARDNLLILAARQTGKTTVIALKALHRALYHDDSTVLIVCPSQKQSVEMLRRVKAFYARLGRPLSSDGESQTTLVLHNRSRILSLPANDAGIRGYTADLLILDEAARIDDDLWVAVSPMVAVSGGTIVALSTPWGARGWFYDQWRNGRGWHRIKITAEECPRISPEFLADQRATMGDFAFRSEYLVEFTSTDAAMWDADTINKIFTPVEGRYV